MKRPTIGMRFGRFLIERELGRGGFATVYSATDQQSGEVVALKVLHEDSGGGYEEATVERFHREVAIVGSLTNKSTVRLLDSGASPALWAAFELLPGRNLSDVIAQHGTLSAGATAHILRQVLMALHEAHARGLLHRDLKPDNIRVFDGEEGALTVKLIDFGIARATVEGDASITRTGELIGTPRYMSPEQLMGKRLTPASDIYSLGLIGFELLFGAGILKGNTLYEQVGRLQDTAMFTQEGSSPEQVRLTAVLRQMVTLERDRRLGSAREVHLALQPEVPRTAVAQKQNEERRRQVGVAAVAALVLIGAFTSFFTHNLVDHADHAHHAHYAQPEHASGVALTQQPVEKERAVVPPPEPSPCGSHDGPWPNDDLYVYIPEGVDLLAAPFVFVAVAEHWYDPADLAHYLEYLQLREHADARGFPVVLASIQKFRNGERVPAKTQKLERAIGAGFEHTFTPKVQRFYADCALTAPAVLFGESSSTGHMLPIAATPPVFFSAAVVSGIRPRLDDYPTRTDPKIPLLIFAHTDNKHAPWTGHSQISAEGDERREVKSRPQPEVLTEFRRELGCLPNPQLTHPGCARHQCDLPLEICVVEGGQWWSDYRMAKMGDVRFAEGGSVSGFPYHAVMWDFLNEVLGLL